MSVGARIKQLREKEGLTLQIFGDKIGKLSPSGISKMEKGERVVTERTIEQICIKFSVNEHWLRTGEGEMYIPRSDTKELLEAIDKAYMNDEEDVKQGMVMFANLNAEQRDLVIKLMQQMQ